MIGYSDRSVCDESLHRTTQSSWNGSAHGGIYIDHADVLEADLVKIVAVETARDVEVNVNVVECPV